MRVGKFFTCLTAIVVSLTAGVGASATPFDAKTLITDFNVITKGNFATQSDVQGNVLIGGNLSNLGAGLLVSKFPGTPTPPTGYGQINVFGNNTGIWSVPGLGAAKAFVGGTNTGAFNVAAVTVPYTFPGAGGVPEEPNNAATFATDIWKPLTDLSTKLAGLTPNGTFNSTTGVFTVTSPGPTIWNVTAAQLEAFTGNFTFTPFPPTLSCLVGTNTHPSTCDGIVNVTGDYDSGTNTFNPLFPMPGLLFNFVDATDITFGNSWEASVLAPLANVQVNGGFLEGNLIAASAAATGTLGHEIHLPAFDCSDNLCDPDGKIPEPASLALLGGALTLFAVLVRRRRTG